jgi:hypothetical protein
MSHGTRPTCQQMLEVMRLMADVVALKNDVPAQRQMLIDGLNRIAGTNQAFFFVAAGWHPMEKPHFTHQTLGKDRDPVFLRYMAEFGIRYPLQADPFCSVSIKDPAAKQLLTYEQALPNRAAEREFDAFMEIRRSGRVTDGVVGITRLVGNRIARELCLSVWTVREHIQRIYRHHGVSGREELMARFMGNGNIK